MSAPPRSTRLTGLDGLRGIAAVIVLLYHLSLVARPFVDTGADGDAWWWLTHTPLKLFTAIAVRLTRRIIAARAGRAGL